ncbi:hypothetical protein KUTeg_023261 [Tegillarca granosa]|uniref:Aldehyde dehydrogenase domain-containing protein n=1 Tax=Tegillarca granosa TaxID=220873 RepID=A0ABQ9E630_TEGGR|nr:hypothetical protein KUTeg_023261 [Tegillarca granosa]
MNNLKKWMKPEKVKKGLLNIMDNCYIHREPFGVALIIGAWNYPFHLSILPMIGALAAGNCVILKPSEECVKVVNGGVKETEALLSEKFDYIFYTGNSVVGKIVMQAASKHLTPVTLELGGKSPVFVDRHCDLNVVAKRLLWGKCANAGQTCVAPDYVMCTKDTQKELIEKLKLALKEFYPDSPSASKDYGRIINERHYKRVLRLISAGGEVAIGGELNESDKFISPTVLSDVKFSDQIMQEEIFGPVLPIVPVADDKEAIQYINSKDKPLAMYIFTNDKKVKQNFLQNTSSGAFLVNDTMVHGGVITLPFGGVGNSVLDIHHILTESYQLLIGPLYPQCLCLSSDGHILVTMYDKWSHDVDKTSKRLVTRMTTTGQILTTYEYDNDKRLFILPWGIEENINKDIGVVNRIRVISGHVVILNASGGLKQKYKGLESEMFYPVRVKCDKFGHIIVSDLNKKIHILDSNGQLIKYLMTDKDLQNKPWSLAMDRNNLLWPSMESHIFEIEFCKNDAINAMNNLKKWMKQEKVKRGLLNIMDSCYIHREPFGVALIVGAWNYPFHLSILPMIGALAAGNCVILKPSEVALSTAQLLEKILPKYIDNECVKVVNGGLKETEALLSEKFDYIFYTGNSVVGKIVMQAASKHLTPVTLELGGKSPVFVDRHCDLNVVAKRLLWGKCANAGQTCVAPDYVMCTKDTQPLATYIFTNDKKVKQNFLPSTSSGASLVNDTMVHGGGPLDPQCLCLSSDGHILVTMCDQWSYDVDQTSKRLVTRMTTTGQILTTNEYDNDKRLFILPCGIDENTNKDIFTCVVNKTSIISGHVVILNASGGLKCTYKGQESEEFDPIRVKCDKFGHIILSDLNRKIHMLDRNGQLIKYLMTNKDLPYSPWSLAIDINNLLWPSMESHIFEIEFCRNDAINAMNNLKTWMKPEKVKRGLLNIMDSCYIHREPFGAALIIGNCVILKPSEECVKVVNGGVKETEELLSEKFDYIFYTGNSVVGKIVMQAASKHLTPVSLELGGKSPVFIDRHCDLNVVATRLLWGKCANAGQTCVAPDYVMCTKDTQKELIEKLKLALKEFYPDSPSVSKDYGRIINERHYKRVLRFISAGGEVAIGGELNESDKFISPTVLSDVKFSDQIMQEEIFGPVLPIAPVADDKEAIQYINSKDKPLAMYIFTNDKKVKQNFLQNTSSGAFLVNDTMVHGGVIILPFGGVGNSGIGSYHGHIRYPPYSDRKLSIIDWLLKKKVKKSSVLPFILVSALCAVLFKMYKAILSQ